MRIPKNRNLTTLLLLGALIILVVIYIFPSRTTMAGSHTMYRTRNISAELKGEAYFCEKCHPEETGNLTALTMGHNRTQCICHGYYRNVTDDDWDINLKHQLTKDAYCTNCHSRYNASGELYVLYGKSSTWVNVENQTGHYISNESELLMNHSKEYFKLFE